MNEVPKKASAFQEKSAVTATDANAIARERFIALCGPRSWNDTRDAWLARGARRAGIAVRRARAIFYSEPIRLSADEYLKIEFSWQAATSAMAQSDDLARAAAALADSVAQQAEREGLRLRAEALGRQLAATHAALSRFE